MPPDPAYDVVFLTGTVGAGKTTTAYALSDLEARAGRRHAVVDLDQVRLLRPPPSDDPWQHEVELANLRDLVRNYRAAGADRIVLAGVLEDARARPRYVEAVGGGRLLVCRLTVDPDVVRARLEHRHRDEPEARAWHLDRTVALTAVLDAGAVEDVRVDTTDRSPEAVAHVVRHAAGWAV